MSGRRVGWAALIVVVGVVACLAAIDWMWTVAPIPPPPGLVSSPLKSPEPPADPSSPTPAPVAASEHLTFEVTDHAGKLRTVTCTIRRKDYEHELEMFGVDPQGIQQEINDELQAALKAEAERRRVDLFFTIRVQNADLENCCSYTPARDPELAKSAQEFILWLRDEAPGLRDELVQVVYRRHGFLFDAEENSLSVDYGTIIHNATGPLVDCFRKLRQAFSDAEAERLARVFVAFFQGLRYESPPDPDGRGRTTLDFRVPTDVLLKQAGDCDSNAAAFCAMWRQIPAHAMLALSRRCEHTLIGVVGTCPAEQFQRQRGNLNFCFYEAVGGEPPRCDPRGDYTYVLIEPARSR